MPAQSVVNGDLKAFRRLLDLQIKFCVRFLRAVVALTLECKNWHDGLVARGVPGMGYTNLAVVISDPSLLFFLIVSSGSSTDTCPFWGHRYFKMGLRLM